MVDSRSPDDPELPKKLFTSEFVLVLLVNSVLACIFYVLVSAVSLYAVEEFHVGEAAAGFASSAFVVGSLLARVFAQQLLAAVNGKKILVFCLCIYILCSLLYILTQDLWSLVSIRVLHGIGFGFASSALSTHIFSRVPQAKRARAAGYYSMAYAVFPAVGPIISLYLIRSVSYDAVFIFCAVFTLLALIAASNIRFPNKSQRAVSAASFFRALRFRDFYEPKVLAVSVIVFIAGASNSGILTFLPLISGAEGAENMVAFYFVAYSIGAVSSRVIFGWVQDKFGDNVAAVPALLLFAAALLILALGDLQIIPVAGIFSGLGFGSLFPIMQAITVSLVPVRQLTSALSTYYIMMDLGLSIGPVLFGIVYQYFGSSFMFLAILSAICFAIVLYLLTHARNQQKG